MDINDAFPSVYLKAADLKGNKVTVVIDACEKALVGEDEKPILTFSGKDKGLVLNKTNANRIASLYGPNTDDWIGKEIKLYPTKVDFQGGLVDAIRVDIEQAVPQAVDDDVTF